MLRRQDVRFQSAPDIGLPLCRLRVPAGLRRKIHQPPGGIQVILIDVEETQRNKRRIT